MGYSIEFEPIGRRGERPEGETLLQAAQALGVDLVSICGGAGTCGRCKVQVMAGAVSPVSERERKALSDAELQQGFRLACRATPLSDCRVHVPPESLTAPQRTQVEGLAVPVQPDPAVRAYEVQPEPASLDDPRADDARLQAALLRVRPDSALHFDLALLQQLSPHLREADAPGGAVREPPQLSLALRGSEVVAAGPAGTRWLGLAVDIGSTKIAGYLVDLESGQTLAAQGLMNPQIAYGEDIIARLNHAGKGAAEAARLQELLVSALNGLAAGLCREVGAQPAQIVDAVAVGNTAIHHLLLRLPVGQLAQSPYVPAVSAPLDVKARDLGLALAPGAYLHTLPNIAGFVGADHVAMLLATGVAEAHGLTLAIDIGTNTEMCLAADGELMSASCASGPAFEGAHIRCGMRAAPGAIERVRIDGDQVICQTIGHQPPVGICGSGLLDAVAQLSLCGVLDRTGRLRDHPRVRQGESGREFVLAGADEGAGQAITLSQRDVRELQLAKGAIRSGIDLLLAANGRRAEEVERVILAGAFGTYIDVVSAIAIGMLPGLPLERFQQVGNAAGTGARLALVSQAMRRAAAELAGRVRYLELARAPGFARTFAQAMYL